MGAALLAPGRGGIAAVARMTARAVVGVGVDLELVSLLDKSSLNVAGKRAHVTKGSRLAYLLYCHFGAIKHKRALYDSLGMARAHPRIGGIPYAIWMHGIEVWRPLSRERQSVLRRAERILVNSHYTLERFQEQHWRLENAHICHLATEQDEPPDAFPDFQGPPTVLILARQDKDQYYKGHRELIECWPRVVSVVPDAHLIIAGNGDGLSLTRELVSQSKAAANIEILGFVSDKDLPALWRRAHVFAMPSRKEGFGIVYVEAMRHGLPVIASVHDAGQEVNQDGVTGYNVNLDKRQELADRLIQLLKDTDLACSLGKASFEYWRDNFRYGAFEQRLERGLHGFLNS